MKAKKAQGAKARRKVAGITAAQASDELQARELARRLEDLTHHCEEARHYCPDEPLFSVESMFAAEGERTKRDGTPKRIIRRAVAIYCERMEAEGQGRARTLAAWEARADEIRRCDFIDRHAESRAFYERHRNDPDEGRGAVDEYREIIRAEQERNEQARDKDPFYYVTPKTSKPVSSWWYSRVMEEKEKTLLLFCEGERIGKRIANAEHDEGLKPPSIETLFDEAQRKVRRTFGDAAATAIKAARDIYLAYSGGATPDEVKRTQRERAADWIKDGVANGDAPSIPQAAAQFGNEIEAEREKGGYATTDALRTALYKHADELGIAEYRKRGK